MCDALKNFKSQFPIKKIITNISYIKKYVISNISEI